MSTDKNYLADTVIICSNMTNEYVSPDLSFVSGKTSMGRQESGRYPIELDFAKLENDVKFVISKDFDSQDLPNLKKIEEYLLSAQIPNDEMDLPKHLKFALHTLSFDKRRDMGECEVHQLAQALISSQKLLLDLVSDDFHLKIRGERPLSYPPRQTIAIDMSPWRFKCPEYSPTYHVDAFVLKNEKNGSSNGWADPEDINKINSGFSEDLNIDAKGFLLHPRGRTGIAGRGLLGKWGANPAVTAVILRTDAIGDGMELLLGKHSEDHFLWLPRGFVLQAQHAYTQICRVIHQEFGWMPGMDIGSLLSQGISYDPRQTDNAWVEMTSFLFRFTHGKSPGEFKSY